MNSMTRRSFLGAAGTTAGTVLTLGIEPFSGSSAVAATQFNAVSASTISKLARFTASVRYDSIPSKALENAKTAILDCLGVAVAGGREESARIAGKLVRDEGGKAETTLLGQGFKVPLAQAAFVNGIAAHAHDFDHSFVLGGQPTSPIIPAALAVGETLGASGKQFLEAYVAGFEVVAALMFAVQNAGGASWHPNGTVGVFGAATASAKLLGLKPPEMEVALSIAASMASGVQSNFGTMTKPLHVGNAARNGVLAAKLAASGFTANTQTLDAANGYFASFYATGKPDLAPINNLGGASALERYGVRFKAYPCGGLTHTSIYAAIQLRSESAITPEMVDHVLVEVPTDTATPLVYRVPKTGLEGKFSMPYLVARALIDGNVTLDSFTDEAVRNPQVLALLERIEMRANPMLQSGSDGSRPGIVTIGLKDGRTRARHEVFPKGSPQVPMTREELLEKFRSCGRGILSKTAVDRALELTTRLESQQNVRPLAATLAS